MTDAQPAHQQDIDDRLQEAFSSDPKASVRNAILRMLADPAKPRDAKGRLRLHPVLLALAVAASLVLATFLYFSFLSP